MRSGAFEALDADWQSAVALFVRWLASLHRAPSTRALYVSALVSWAAAGGRPGHVDRTLVARWLGDLRRRGISQSTRNLHVCALRAFYGMQAAMGAAPAESVAAIPRTRRPPERVVRHLTPAQVGDVLAALPLDTWLGVRDFALIHTLWGTGLRASEVAALRVSDLLPDGHVYVAPGKGRQDRYVPLTPELAGVLDGWLRVRQQARPGNAAALWVRRNGAPLAGGPAVWRIVSRRIWLGIGIAGGTHRVLRGAKPWQGHYPHELRASFATGLLARGLPITAIAQLLGHATLEATARYLAVDLDLLRRAISAHPRAQRVSDDHALPRPLPRASHVGESGSDCSPATKRRNAARVSALQVLTPTAPRRRR